MKLEKKLSTVVLNSISDCKRELLITVSDEEFSKFYKEVISKYQKKVKMPGFRPGKVPFNIIKNAYGDSIQIEAEEATVSNFFKEYVQQNDVNIVGQPELIDVQKSDDNKSYIYRLNFDVLPEFELGDYKSFLLKEPVYRVTDADIDKEINLLARSIGTKEKAEQITDYDMQVVVDSYKVDPETKEALLDDEPVKDIAIDLSRVTAPKLKESLLNLKVSDEFLYEPDVQENNFQSEYIVIKEIYRIILPEINDEFAKKATQDRLETLEDFRQEIGFAIQKQWDDRTRQELESQISDKLIEMHKDFDIPVALLSMAEEQIINNLKSRKADLENPYVKEYIKDQSEKLVRLEIIRDKIIEKEELKVEDFDIDRFIDSYFNSIQEKGDTVSREAFAGFVKNDERTMQALLNQKLTEFLLDFAKTEEIDFEEYTRKIDEEIEQEIAMQKNTDTSTETEAEKIETEIEDTDTSK